MTHQVHAFEPPERFVAGTVGPPGERTFFLQARGGGRVVSVALEKVQVSLLAEKLEELLTEAQRRFGVELPELPATGIADNDPLDTPVDEEFRVGTLGLAFDVDTSTVVIEAIAVGEAEVEVTLGAEDDDEDDEDEDDDEPDDDLDRLRVRLTPQDTRRFIERARRVVNAGRQPCPLCGQPLDPSGHLCPRHNGYHR
ncbi:conserved hypothetical protein [Micromonospora pallida]|uniref:Repeat protein (TIGR03847 family) n=1 Tax=Micromonospora pallida TaxID=145854 RepID=A0A1C6RYL1_9ACTN|nr:DUF3090 domain-containing protein [Micromonospora pallida]SCL22311.1 conserved hypothetical protein [Micromonospora pallida]